MYAKAREENVSEGRTKKAAMNVAFNFLNQILTLILSFVSRTVFVWGLGAEYLGINGLFSDVLGLLSMADLGLARRWFIVFINLWLIMIIEK